MAKIFVESYGCSASFADSEMISGLILNGGHTLVEDSSESDLNVVVTCLHDHLDANARIDLFSCEVLLVQHLQLPHLSSC